MFEINSSNRNNKAQKNAEKIVKQMYDDDKFSKWLGIEIIDVSPGKVVAKLTVREDMLNGFGIMHGGISYALADSAFAFAANSHGRICVSLNQTMNYPAACSAGDELIASAEEISLSQKTGVYDVTVKNQNNETVGLFRGTVYRTTKHHELKD